MMVNRMMIRQYGLMIRQYGLMIRQYGMMIENDECNDDPTIRHDDRIMICEAGLYLSIYIHVFLRGGDDDDENVRCDRYERRSRHHSRHHSHHHSRHHSRHLQFFQD